MLAKTCLIKLDLINHWDADKNLTKLHLNRIENTYTQEQLPRDLFTGNELALRTPIMILLYHVKRKQILINPNPFVQ